jgi:hypothetical protein
MSTFSTSYQRRAIAVARSGLFWWSAEDHLDLVAEHLAAEILHRHLGGLERPFAAVIGIDPGLIVQNADLDALRRRRRAIKDRSMRRPPTIPISCFCSQQFLFRIIPPTIFYNPAAAHLFQISQ